MGRIKLTNQRYTVRCHPKVINDVRKYAKEKSEEYDKSRNSNLSKEN